MQECEELQSHSLLQLYRGAGAGPGGGTEAGCQVSLDQGELDTMQGRLDTMQGRLETMQLEKEETEKLVLGMIQQY